MKDPIVRIENQKCLLAVKKEFYETEAIIAATQKFTNKCIVFIDSFEPSTIDVYFERKNSSVPSDIEAIAKEFCNELLEQQMRLTLEKKFGDLRTIIVKQAFSPISKFENDGKK